MNWRGTAVILPALSRAFAQLRRPRVWLPLMLLAVAGLLAEPYLEAIYSYGAGRRALDRNHAREARSWFERCLRVWPRSPAVHLLASRAARLTRDHEAAEHHLTECQRLEGEPSEESNLEWALLQAENGNLEGVEEFLRARAARDPTHAGPILKALAAGYLRLYRFNDAMQGLEAALRLAPDDPHALYLRGRAWERVHAYPKAAEDYRNVLAHDPADDDARLRLANSLLENGQPADALDHLELLRRRQSNNPEVLVRLAFAWNAVGRLEDSLRLIDEVLARHPDFPPAISARGQLAFLAERPAEAEGWLRRAVTVNPYDRQAHYVLQQCFEQQGKTAEAKTQRERLKEVEETIDRLITISNRLMPSTPHDPALHYELGTILTKMGHEELGARWFASALEQDPNFGQAHEALAKYYDRVGNHEEAERHRRKRN
jgi:tetratricopeptide (TPR) repeat protein